jgi:hypothetical protein
MLDAVGFVSKLIWAVAQWFLLALSPIVVSLFINIGILKFKGYKRIRSLSKWKQRGVLTRLLVDFPRQLAMDIMTRDPNKYPYYGTILFCGSQGCGKTIAMVYYLQKIMKKYPLSQGFANFTVLLNGDAYRDFNEQVDIVQVPEFNGWREIVDHNNGESGITFLIDELSVWFNNKDSKDFPPTFLQDLNQQRKQRKMTIGTAQRFGLLAKDIRALPEYIYLPKTLFGCLTVVFVSRPENWDNEKNRFKKYELFRTWFFVHNKKLRHSYDTFQRVQRSARDGFSANSFINPTPRAEGSV